MTSGKRTSSMVFGAADGLTLILGLILGLAVSGQPGSSVWHAALSGGVAEFGGMALAQYWADPDKDKVSALFNGGASAVTVVVPGLPFALMPRTPAVVLGAILIVLFGIALTWLRKETGWAAAARTFGLLLCAAALSVGANVVPT